MNECLSLAQIRIRRHLDSPFHDNGAGVRHLGARLDVYNEGLWAQCSSCGEIIRGIENLAYRGYFDGTHTTPGKVKTFICKRCLKYNP